MYKNVFTKKLPKIFFYAYIKRGKNRINGTAIHLLDTTGLQIKSPVTRMVFLFWSGWLVRLERSQTPQTFVSTLG